MNQLPIELPNGPTEGLTTHAMLVPWGLFAQRIGLVEAMEDVPIHNGGGSTHPKARCSCFWSPSLDRKSGVSAQNSATRQEVSCRLRPQRQWPAGGAPARGIPLRNRPRPTTILPLSSYPVVET